MSWDVSSGKIPDAIVRNHELMLEEAEEQAWIDTHCGDCDNELNEDGQCPECNYSNEYGRV